jgi:hypothetical protein
MARGVNWRQRASTARHSHDTGVPHPLHLLFERLAVVLQQAM